MMWRVIFLLYNFTTIYYWINYYVCFFLSIALYNFNNNKCIALWSAPARNTQAYRLPSIS